MVARIHRLTTLALLCVSAGWAVCFAAEGEPQFAVVGLAAIGIPYAAFLGIEFALLARLGGRDLVEAASRKELMRAWLGEIAAAVLVFCWRQPFRANAEPDYLSAVAYKRSGVVLVHGLLCNRGLWNPLLVQLRARGISFAAVNLEPPFASITSLAGIVDTAVRRVEEATGCRPVIVGHSMGGLVIRAWLADYRGASRVCRVITVATPHRGAWLARVARSDSGRQMRLESDWLRNLASRESVADRRRFVCFFGRCDNVVFPTSSAALPGADNRHISAVAHVGMVYHPSVIAEILESAGSEDRAAS